MSTRCVVHFQSGGKTEAIVYRHSDGYPDGEHGVLASLKKFFNEVQAVTTDTRFADAPFLAAKYVVWEARLAQDYFLKKGQSPHRLDFLGVGVIMTEPGDIEYRYKVSCRDGDVPEVTYEEV